MSLESDGRSIEFYDETSHLNYLFKLVLELFQEQMTATVCKGNAVEGQRKFDIGRERYLTWLKEEEKMANE